MKEVEFTLMCQSVRRDDQEEAGGSGGQTMSLDELVLLLRTVLRSRNKQAAGIRYVFSSCHSCGTHVVYTCVATSSKQYAFDMLPEAFTDSNPKT